MQNAVRGPFVSECRERREVYSRAHRGIEKRSRRMKDSFQVRDRVPRFGGGSRPLRQTYSVLARTTGCDIRFSASTRGADDRVRRRSRAAGAQDREDWKGRRIERGTYSKSPGPSSRS